MISEPFLYANTPWLQDYLDNLYLLLISPSSYASNGWVRSLNTRCFLMCRLLCSRKCRYTAILVVCRERIHDINRMRGALKLIFLRLRQPCRRGQLVIPTGLYSDRSIFRQVVIPTGRYSDRPIFRQVDIPTGRYSDRSIFRQVVIPTGRYSDRSLFRQAYIPTGRYSDRSIGLF